MERGWIWARGVAEIAQRAAELVLNHAAYQRRIKNDVAAHRRQETGERGFSRSTNPIGNAITKTSFLF